MPHVLLTLAVDRLMVTLGFVVRRFVFGASVVPWQLPFISPFAGYYMTPTSMTLMPCSCLLRGNNRSVMPLDVLGSTRATLMRLASLRPCPEGLGNLFEAHRDGDSQQGVPSKRESSARADYVPALCTHRPSLLPIE